MRPCTTTYDGDLMPRGRYHSCGHELVHRGGTLVMRRVCPNCPREDRRSGPRVPEEER
jgi:hypothetical protein